MLLSLTIPVDIVLWDSHPLALGATPKQVFIDGIAQLKSPHSVKKPIEFQVPPKVPNFDKEAKDAVKYEGLPPLLPSSKIDSAIFTNVRKLYTRDISGTKIRSLDYAKEGNYGVVIVVKGNVLCE